MKEPKSGKSKKHKRSKGQHKSSKKSHRHRRRHSSSSGSSSSGDERVAGSARSQLDRERAAVTGARHIIASQQSVRKSFRELLWELDNGRAVGLAGMPDSLLRAQLQHVLELLGLKCTKGQFWLPSGSPATLSVLGFVFDEPLTKVPQPPPGMPMPAQPAAAATAAATAATAAPGPAAPKPASVTGPQLPTQAELQAADAAAATAAAAAAAAAAGAGAGEEQPPSQAGEPLDATTGGGPAGPPSPKPGAGAEQPQAGSDMDSPRPRRAVVGPAMPSAELLAAAAAWHAEVEAAGGYDAGPEEEDAGPLIGPPPPAFIDEADAAPADAREAQVVRVLRVLAAAAAEAPAGPAAAAAGPPPPGAPGAPDPYEVLGVGPSEDAGAVRKAYWRLSLLVHPDKCSHPGAQEAFQAVSKAAQLLQDAGQRKQLDAAQADAVLRKQALAAAEAAQREVAWKVARGEAVPPELAATLAAAKAAGAGPAQRESWMTDLPAAQQRTAASALANLSQTSQSSFSRFGLRERGDTSGWTDTPEQAQLRAAGLLTSGDAGGARLLGPPPSGLSGEDGGAVPPALAAAMAAYTQQHRHKSLLEQHLEGGGAPKRAPARPQQPGGDAGGGREEKASNSSKSSKSSKASKRDKQGSDDKEGSKKRKAAAGGEPGKAGDDWRPWKPFDREKDMEVTAMKPRTAQDLLKQAGALSSRFSSGR